jgi:hypothetical protein
MTKIYYSCHKDTNDSVIIKYRSIKEDKAFGWKKSPGLATETLTLLAGARTIKYNYEPQEGRLSDVNNIADLILKGYLEKPRSFFAKLSHLISNLYCKLTMQPTHQETLAALVDSVKKKSFNVDVSDRIKIQRNHQVEKAELQKKVDEKLISKSSAELKRMNAEKVYNGLIIRQTTLERSFAHEQRLFGLTIKQNKLNKLNLNFDLNNVTIEKLLDTESTPEKIEAAWNAHVENSADLQEALKELVLLKEEIPKSKLLFESAEKIKKNEDSEYNQLIQQQRNLNKNIYNYEKARLDAKNEKIRKESAEKLAEIQRKIDKYEAISDGLKKFNRTR